MLSDRLRVRKPFMVVGGVAAAMMTVIYLLEAGLHPSYYTLAIILALLSFSLGIAYTPWMASFTETVEARNPALTATGLAIWGWIIRVVVFLAFITLPNVITSVTPLVNFGGVTAPYAKQIAFAQTHADIVAIATKDAPEIAFVTQHADIVALAQKDSVQLANAQKFAPELAVIQAHAALFTKLAGYSNPAKIPANLVKQVEEAAGGGSTKADIAKGGAMLLTISANKAAIDGVIAVGGDLQKIAPYAAQLTKLQAVAPQLAQIKPYSAQLKALAAIPANVQAYIKANTAQVTKAAADAPGQWKTWYWICFGGILFFLGSIPLLRGRWRPADARRDEAEHEAMVEAELAAMHS
jgi:MFS transporter, ACS family, D-galactonate transporter